MKKSTKKLTLHRETVVRLDAMAKVAAGTWATRYKERDITFTQPGGITAFPCDIPVYTTFC